MGEERKVWIDIVKADDLDAHMAENGQAKANASLVSQMFREFPLNEKSKILIPGCGTGQMFDFMNPLELSRYEITFTDINDAFIECLKGRLKRNKIFKYHTCKDDLEDSHLSGSYDGILVVLLLEHIDWKKGLGCLLRFCPKNIYFIIQEQTPGSEILAADKVLRPSISEFAKISKMKLISRQELTRFLGDQGFSRLGEFVSDVPDNKRMIGLVFVRDSMP
jgi:SAM-dependent methyltransferase